MKLRLLAVVAVCCAVMAVMWLEQSTTSPGARLSDRSAQSQAVPTPADQCRAEEQTYLTIPEWFLVYSPKEYAADVQHRSPSAFPFFDHILQFWNGYRVVVRATKDDYPMNGGYHLMVVVIGVSTTVEYGMKGIYEATLGRLTEATCPHGATREDQLAASVAHEYADFLDEQPWYNFDYRNALRRVWTETGLWGSHPIRKWERKYALTTEYGIKAVYAWLLRQGSEATYGAVESTTMCVLDRAPEIRGDELPELKIVVRNADGSVLASFPRYQPFTDYAAKLAAKGVNFIEIAGNRNAILVGAIVPRMFDTRANVLLTEPIITRPGTQRIILVVPVNRLSETLLDLERRGAKLEHVYDY
jgi:hypothetical protein